MPGENLPGSGTSMWEDLRRDGRAKAAVNTLRVGKSFVTLSADHSSAGELCVDTIARVAGQVDRVEYPTDLQRAAVNNAINALEAGFGHNRAQADHAGGNTCVQCIVAAQAANL